MKTFIVEKRMTNSTDGYYNVVVQGEENVLNRTIITSKLQFFTYEGGYNYCHPWETAEQVAIFIAAGLNELERLKALQRRQIILLPDELTAHCKECNSFNVDKVTKEFVCNKCGSRKKEISSKDNKEITGPPVEVKYRIDYYNGNDLLRTENRTHTTGVAPSESMVKNALHSIFIEKGLKPFDNASAEVFQNGELVDRITLV